MDWKGLVRTVRDMAVKNSPAIFTGLGIVGFGTSVVMAAKAGPRAQDIHARERWEREDVLEAPIPEDKRRDLLKDSYIREAKELAPLYLPVAAVWTASAGFVLMANKIHSDRQTAIMTAYSISTETLARYQDKVIAKLGEEVHKDILGETTREMVHDNPPKDLEQERIVNPEGMVRCYDNVTGRYFFSSKDRILEAESAINRRLLNETMVPLQEFYYELGLEEKFNLGEAMGWDISSPYSASENSLRVWFTPMLDDDKNPCLALNYHVLIFEKHA